MQSTHIFLSVKSYIGLVSKWFLHEQQRILRWSAWFGASLANIRRRCCVATLSKHAIPYLCEDATPCVPKFLPATSPHERSDMIGLPGSNERVMDGTVLWYVRGSSERMRVSGRRVRICSPQEGICTTLKP